MNNQIQSQQMNVSSTNMNDSGNKENMLPFFALPQFQHQQPQMAPQMWSMPGSQAYLDEQKRFENMIADVQRSADAWQAQSMMTYPYGYPFALVNNQATAPGSAGPSDNSNAPKNAPAEGEDLPDWKVKFEEVSGRLALLGNHQYNVSLAEIKRRLGKPEHLNVSALTGILRIAKDKKSAEDLTNKLAKSGLTLEQGRRKSEKSTVFTALTEEETKQVVADFQNLTDTHFYEKDLAYESLARTTSLEEHAMKIKRTQCAQMAMQDIFKVLDKVNSPVCDAPTEVQSSLHPKTQEAFDNFSKVTHGFGLPALRVSWDAYNRTLGECAKAYQNPKAFCDELQRPLPQSINAMFGMNGDQMPATGPGFAPAMTPMQRNSGAGMEQAKKTSPKGQAKEQSKA